MTDALTLFAEYQPRPGLYVLPGAFDPRPLEAIIAEILEQAPLRSVMTPNGPMSVRMSNCGHVGWIADERGYRYSERDPLTGGAWPALPPELSRLADTVCRRVGLPPFAPDACLINAYAPSAKMGLHQDRDEPDQAQPVVSLSIGASADFAVKPGVTRNGAALRLKLHAGDAVILSGEARLAYHGITKIRGTPGTDGTRINLTLRRVR